MIVVLGIASAFACNYCKNKGWCENRPKKKNNPDKKLSVLRPKLRIQEPEEEPNEFPVTNTLNIQVDKFENRARNFKLNDTNDISLEEILSVEEL